MFDDVVALGRERPLRGFVERFLGRLESLDDAREVLHDTGVGLGVAAALELLLAFAAGSLSSSPEPGNGAALLAAMLLAPAAAALRRGPARAAALAAATFAVLTVALAIPLNLVASRDAMLPVFAKAVTLDAALLVLGVRAARGALFLSRTERK